MSMATFYLKAYFPDEETCMRVKDEFNEMLKDLVSLYQDWQRSRGADKPNEVARDLIARHPLAGPFMDGVELRPDDTHMNGRSGIIPAMEDDYGLEWDCDGIYLSCEVWSSSSWDSLVDWLLEHGATSAGWISEEDVSPWDAIVLRSRGEDRVLMTRTGDFREV